MNGFDLNIEPDEDERDAARVLVDATIGGFPYRFLLDTGAARSRVVFDDYTSTFDGPEHHSSAGVFAAGTQEVIRVLWIELGPISKQDVPLIRLAASDRERTNLIGMDLLKDFCCHFLFEEQRVVVQEEPPGDVPFHELMVDTKFHPYVTLRFGESTATAVWDTGASITVADMSFINTYSTLFQEARTSQGTDATGATMETPLFSMVSPMIGRQEFSPHTVAGVDLSHVNAHAELPMDLILGYTTLRQANWVFDFPRKRWAISQRVKDR
jgi:predicted aspartyl protease